MRWELREVERELGGKPVLRGVNLDLDASSLAIIGPSGGGKSTLLRVLGGLIAPDRGEVVLDGHRVDYAAAAVRAHRKRVGFVFQSHGLFDHLTGLDNITLPLIHVHGLSKATAQERARGLLERFGLADQADKHPFAMSGGQQQRVAICRAMAIQPEVLILDEPTSALDPEYTSEVLDMLREVQLGGQDLVLVTHHMGFARQACDQVAYLADGTILEVGTAAQMFTAPTDPGLQRFLATILEWDIT